MFCCFSRFSILLLRIPETFKIEIRIVSKLLDTDEHKPVDVEYLNGHFVSFFIFFYQEAEMLY